MLNLAKKQELVQEVNKTLSNTVSAVVVDYRGLTATDMTEFRSAARSCDIELRVLRNTLARRAVYGTEFECLREHFVGPTLLALSSDEPGAPAKLIQNFAAQNEHLKVRAVALEGQLYGAEDLKRIAELPSRDEALSQLMAVMKAPIQKLVQVAQAVPTKLVRTLAAVQQSKSNEGE